MKAPQLLISMVDNLPGDFVDTFEREARFAELRIKGERRPQLGTASNFRMAYSNGCFCLHSGNWGHPFNYTKLSS